MPFVVHEQTGSKVFSDPKECEECLLYDQTHRQSILWVKLPHMACISRDFDYFIRNTRRLQRRSLRLPTRSKSEQTGHLCTTAQAGADPGIFVCRSKFPGLKVGRRS